MSGKKKLWQIVKPLFSKNVKAKAAIKLVKNYNMIDHGIEIAKLIKKFFANIAKNIKNIYERTKCNFDKSGVEWSFTSTAGMEYAEITSIHENNNKADKKNIAK